MEITAWRAGKSGLASLGDILVSECYRFVSRMPTAPTPTPIIRQLLGMPRNLKARRKPRESLLVTQLAPGRFQVNVTSSHERIQAAWRRMDTEWKIRRVVVPSDSSSQMSIDDHYQQSGGLAKKNPFEACGSRGAAIVYRGGLPTLGKHR